MSRPKEPLASMRADCVEFQSCMHLPCQCSRASSAPAATTSPAPASGTDAGYLEVHKELLELHVRKSATYGNDGERFHNFVALGQATGKPPERYVWERLLEKTIRALNMIDNGQALEVKEGKDVAALGIIAEALRRRGDG